MCACKNINISSTLVFICVLKASAMSLMIKNSLKLANEQSICHIASLIAFKVIQKTMRVGIKSSRCPLLAQHTIYLMCLKPRKRVQNETFQTLTALCSVLDSNTHRSQQLFSSSTQSTHTRPTDWNKRCWRFKMLWRFSTEFCAAFCFESPGDKTTLCKSNWGMECQSTLVNAQTASMKEKSLFSLN